MYSLSYSGHDWEIRYNGGIYLTTDCFLKAERLIWKLDYILNKERGEYSDEIY
jgi:hypothetical protein